MHRSSGIIEICNTQSKWHVKKEYDMVHGMCGRFVGTYSTIGSWSRCFEFYSWIRPGPYLCLSSLSFFWNLKFADLDDV